MNISSHWYEPKEYPDNGKAKFRGHLTKRRKYLVLKPLNSRAARLGLYASDANPTFSNGMEECFIIKQHGLS